MRKLFPFVIAGALLCLQGRASNKDSNVVISSAVENYIFKYDKKKKSVSIGQELSSVYKCLDYRTEVPVVEFYDDKTAIESVDIYVSGKRSSKIVPRYEYYSIDNIFYSDARICYFSLPLEKKENSSEVRFEKVVNDPRYFTNIFLSNPYRVEEKTVSFTIPRWMKVEIMEFNFKGNNIRKTSEYNSKLDADVITYSIRNLRPREREPNSPGATYTEPHLLLLNKYAEVDGVKITFFNTLQDQYAWYRALVKDLPTGEEAIKARALQITSGASDDMDKVKKVLYWMYDNVRYIAFEDGIAGFKPETASEVLRKKYGDCKGMANLTREFLRSLGFDARLCWIGTNHIAYDYSTPTIAVDNHMICALLYKGKTYFLDATENYIGFNEYAERIQGRDVLIEDGDGFIRTRVPQTNHLQNTDVEKLNYQVVNNVLEGSVTREWKGEEKEYLYFRLHAMKKENSRDAFIKYLNDGNSGYVISEFSTSELDNYDKPLSVQYKVKNTKGISAFDKDIYLDLDHRRELSGFTFDAGERSHDYWFSYKMNTQLEVQVKMPEGYQLNAKPADLSIKNDVYEIMASVQQAAGKIIYKKNIILKDIRLKKENFGQWNSDIKKLNNFYNEQVVLTKK